MTIFDFAVGELGRHTGWSPAVARGTLRIALRAGGVKVETLQPSQLSIVLERLMPRELELRGVSDPAPICNALSHAVESFEVLSVSADADDVFRRLAGAS